MPLQLIWKEQIILLVLWLFKAIIVFFYKVDRGLFQTLEELQLDRQVKYLRMHSH